MIQVKPVTSVTNPNGSTTGGSCGSETNCVAVRGACEILKARLAPYRAKLGPKATWVDVIREANSNNVDLCAHYLMEVEKDKYYGYQVWGVGVTEVEVDILTGEMRVVRTDLLEDAGLSTSPQVDIGQVEGAFTMGLGLWTSEEIKYHPETGQLLTMNTWETSHQRPRTSLRTSGSLFCPTPGTPTECSPPRRRESRPSSWESLFSSPSGMLSTQAGKTVASLVGGS